MNGIGDKSMSGDAMTAENPIRMHGTDGGEDYIVVAKSGDVALGLRFIIVPHTEGHGIMVRIRAAAFPGVHTLVDSTEIVKAFGNIPWQNFPTGENTKNRASLQCPVNIAKTATAMVPQGVLELRLASKIHAFLGEFVTNDQWIFPYTDFVDAVEFEISRICGGVGSGKAGVAMTIAKQDPSFAKGFKLLTDTYAEIMKVEYEKIDAKVGHLVNTWVSENPETQLGEPEDSSQEFGPMTAPEAPDYGDFDDDDEGFAYDA